MVISLVYLAAQIRAQSREARLSAMHEISQSFRESLAAGSDMTMAEIVTRANENFDAVSDAERIVLISGNQRVIRVFEEAFHQRREGRLDEYIWDVMVKQYASFLSAPSMARVWELRKEFYDPEFRAFVDSLDRSEFRLR